MQQQFELLHDKLRRSPRWLYAVFTVALIGSLGIGIVFVLVGATSDLRLLGVLTSTVLLGFFLSHVRFLHRRRSPEAVTRWVALVSIGIFLLLVVGLLTRSVRAMLLLYVGYFVLAGMASSRFVPRDESRNR